MLLLWPLKQHIKYILKISWPIIIGQLGMILTGFFDNLMVSKLGYNQLAAAGISNSVYFLIAVFPMGITMAFSTIISIHQGKKDSKAGAFLFRDATVITALVSTLTTVLLLLSVHYFHLLQQDAAVESLAKPYLTLLAYSAIPMLFFFMLKNIADGYKYTQAGMVVTLLILVLNIFFNWVFIYGNLGSPAYGLNGAGYATLLARLLAVLLIGMLLHRKAEIPLDLQRIKNAFKHRTQRSFYRQILRIGVPSGLQYFFEVAAFVLAAIMAGWMGSKELAAHQLAITVAALTYMFASGISSGASISVAQAYGQEDRSLIRHFGNASFLLSATCMLLFAVVFLLFNEEISAQFSDNQEVVLLGAQLLFMAAIFQLSDGIQAVSIGLLRGMEDVRIPSIITLLAYWAVAIPLGYYLGFVLNYGVRGLWIGLTLGLSFSGALLCTRFYKLVKSSK